MSTGELLNIEPLELKFPFELKKQISCSLQVSNKTENYVAFKVKTTNPKKYCVRPNTGMSVVAPEGATAKDITPEMFGKESGNVVEECKLRVVYVAPPQPPSPVPEGSEEGGSPRGSVSDNGHLSGSESAASRTFGDSQDRPAEAKALIAKLTEEKNAAIHQNNKLRQELELLRREASKGQGGVSIVLVILVGLIGIILGYIMKKA
ncbi:hypothetical protein Cgig2_002531 [Carnegiea gigantea]|uniref:MSP domain-containing protein n=1 Tax=Carnegiea gigantea TaxID=171969 RepID=A0A9Q1QPI9_9CARY|nr:hypothetical protein Cgig2_002531 [Carnegiea gigantea]